MFVAWNTGGPPVESELTLQVLPLVERGAEVDRGFLDETREWAGRRVEGLSGGYNNEKKWWKCFRSALILHSHRGPSRRVGAARVGGAPGRVFGLPRRITRLRLDVR